MQGAVSVSSKYRKLTFKACTSVVNIQNLLRASQQGAISVCVSVMRIARGCSINASTLVFPVDISIPVNTHTQHTHTAHTGVCGKKKVLSRVTRGSTQ
jgi:hypothetical protein